MGGAAPRPRVPARAKVAEGDARALAPGGRAVLDLAGKEIAGATFAPRSWARFGATTLLEERSIASGWEHVESRWTILSGGEERQHVVCQRLYSACPIQDGTRALDRIRSTS